MHPLLRRLGGGALGLVMPVLAQPSAYASCAEDAGPEGSPVVLVGTAEENRRGYTRLAVEEVWHGPDLDSEVWVLSGQEQPPFPLSLLSGVSSSVDADLVEGGRYVVGASRSFSTGACSVTEWPAAQRDRPGEVRAPVEGGLQGADPPAGPLAIGAWTAGGALAVAGLLVLRRRRRAGTVHERS